MSEPLLIERGSLLNFSGGGFWAPHPHRLELVWYRQAEYYFQAYKSLCVKQGEDAAGSCALVLGADSAFDAKVEGRRMIIYVNSWDDQAPRRMLEALLFKFTQNSGARYDLRTTGDQPLVEHRRDPIWGDNLDGSGKNLMGLALMHVREKLCR